MLRNLTGWLVMFLGVGTWIVGAPRGPFIDGGIRSRSIRGSLIAVVLSVA